jgi:hypothetical protein
MLAVGRDLFFNNACPAATGNYHQYNQTADDGAVIFCAQSSFVAAV